MEEIYNINNALNELESTMYKYKTNVKKIWDTNLIPFMNSGDCMVFDNIIDKDYDKFVNFFMKQKTYVIMLETYERLIRRKNYLENNNVTQ